MRKQLTKRDIKQLKAQRASLLSVTSIDEDIAGVIRMIDDMIKHAWVPSK